MAKAVKGNDSAPEAAKAEHVSTADGNTEAEAIKIDP